MGQHSNHLWESENNLGWEVRYQRQGLLQCSQLFKILIENNLTIQILQLQMLQISIFKVTMI